MRLRVSEEDFTVRRWLTKHLGARSTSLLLVQKSAPYSKNDKKGAPYSKKLKKNGGWKTYSQARNQIFPGPTSAKKNYGEKCQKINFMVKIKIKMSKIKFHDKNNFFSFFFFFGRGGMAPSRPH